MSEKWLPENQQVYAGTVVSQEFFQAKSGVVYFKLSCRVEGKPTNKWDLKSEVQPMTKYEEVGILFDFEKEYAVRDLEKFLGKEIDPVELNPDTPGYLSLRDRKVHLTAKVNAYGDGEAKVYWNLFQPEQKTTPKVPTDAISALNAKIKASKERLAQKDAEAAGLVGAGSESPF